MQTVTVSATITFSSDLVLTARIIVNRLIGYLRMIVRIS